ncbi:hypothetical protein [Paraburkholderia sp. SIMBA_054]|uniref:hypothetical protein n=1 Tax=Paraburkholderia sp. SIMBA_054 TaxID=3085795 RepID=UPI00397A9819
MKMQNAKSTKLWPIIEPDDRLPIPAAGWAVVNLVAALAIAVPFVVLLITLALGLSMANELRTFIDAHASHGSLAPAIAANTVKVFLLLAIFRIAAILVTTVPYLVRQGREGLRTYIES